MHPIASSRSKLMLAIALLLVAAGLLTYRFYDPVLDYWAHRDAVDDQIAAAIAGNAPGTIPLVESSPSEENERALFLDVLATQRAEVLVVPPQAMQAQAPDRTARSLMAQRLARAIRLHTGQTVADPMLVMRALGSKRRSYEPERVERLARQLGAQLIITGDVAMRSAGGPEALQYDLTLALRTPNTEPRTLRYQGVTFSDALPPEEAFRRDVLPQLLQALPTRTAPVVTPVGAPDYTLPADPYVWTETPAALPIEQALRLQLFAAWYPRADGRAKQMWERSLIAIDDAPEDDGVVRLLRARAAFHLGRRPFAATLMHQPATAAERALQHVINGNLPEAESATTGIAEPMLRLLADIELEDLRGGYNRTHGHEARREQWLKQLPGYAPLLYARLSEPDWFVEGVHSILALALQERGVEPSSWRLQVQELADRVSPYVELALSAVFDTRFNLPAAIDDSRYAVWRREAKNWGARGLHAELTPADYFDLIYAINRAAALKTVQSIAFKQALPDAALDAAHEFQRRFALDSDIAYTESTILRQQAHRRGARDALSPIPPTAQRIARDAYIWEGGETAYTPSLEYLLWRKHYVKYLDEPPATNRYWPQPTENRFAATKPVPAAEIERRVRWNLRKLQYVQTEFKVLEDIEADLHQLGRSAELATLLRDNSERFNGSNRRIDFLARIAQRQADHRQEEDLYRQAIESAPNDWRNYQRLGWLYLEQRRPIDAQQTYLRFPLFKSKDGNLVEIGNNAHTAAWSLYKTGHAELAKPLYEISRNLDTGSGAQMRSAATLEHMNGNYARAAYHIERELHRYGGEENAALLIEYSFLLGRTDAAWKQFATLSLQAKTGPPFWAAAVGHRMLGHSDDDIVRFARAWDLPPERGSAGVLRDAMVFGALFLDRPASAEALRAVKDVNAMHGDRSFVHVATGYHAFLRRDYGAMLREWDTLHRSNVNVSIRAEKSYAYTLPYFALGHAVLGQMQSFQLAIDAYGKHFNGQFDHILAEAINAAFARDHARAEALFWRAFVHRPPNDVRPMPSELSLLELLEIVYEQTNQERYRVLLLDIGKRVQQVWPYSFAYAFEAKHAAAAVDRRRALGFALRLDRRSARIQHFGREEMRAAETWFADHDPFTKQRLVKTGE